MAHGRGVVATCDVRYLSRKITVAPPMALSAGYVLESKRFHIVSSLESSIACGDDAKKAASGLPKGSLDRHRDLPRAVTG